jgi:uncharacterized membrane protein
MRSRLLAFLAAMIALANLLGFLAVQMGPVRVHFLQLPIILTALALGPLPGALVGFLGPTVNALFLPQANPYILVGNAILGFITGLVNRRISGRFKRPIFPQTISVVSAFMVQAPYVYLTDVYLVGMPSLIVQLIMAALFLEDIVCMLVSHVILFRINVPKLIP